MYVMLICRFYGFFFLSKWPDTKLDVLIIKSV
jgi:hypothetical protein